MSGADHSNPDRKDDHAGQAMVRALRAMLPSDVAVSAGRIGTCHVSLFDVEMAATAHAVPARRAEFAAGRGHARAALRQLGCRDQPIPRAVDRRPVWPPGYVGSIAHSSTLCGAIAASDRSYLGLGFDLEPAQTLDPDLYAIVGRPEEQESFRRPVASPAGPLDRGRLVFAIKETVFKACYPLVRCWFDFLAVRVEIDAAARSFSARIVEVDAALPGHTELHGLWDVVGGHVVAVLSLTREGETDAGGFEGVQTHESGAPGRVS
jgi:4'-phosphopantetheinyl transferase EntD